MWCRYIIYIMYVDIILISTTTASSKKPTKRNRRFQTLQVTFLATSRVAPWGLMADYVFLSRNVSVCTPCIRLEVFCLHYCAALKNAMMIAFTFVQENPTNHAYHSKSLTFIVVRLWIFFEVKINATTTFVGHRSLQSKTMNNLFQYT